MAASEVCHSCARSMTAVEVVCGGFCKAVFHYSCAKITEELYNEVSGSSAIFWMCKGCRDIMSNARFKNALTSMNAAAMELNDTYQKIIDEMKSEIKASLIAEIRQEIQGGFNKLSPALLSPRPQIFKFGKSNTPKRDREDENASYDRPTKMLRGIGPTVVNVPSAPVDKPADKFWVYLTGISPDVSQSDIEKLAKESLDVDEVVVRSLIPRGRPLSTLSFVSFKVGVSLELKSKALDPSSWPQGIEFREFIEDNTKTRHFWKPVMNADPGPANSD